LSLVNGKGLGRILKKMTCGRGNRFFGGLLYWKDLDVRHLIDVMHVEKNVCESLLRTLLNTDRKTRDHGVIPRSEIAGTKPPYVCPGCFIHTYSNNMINRFHVQ
jgi:hypothetical protein